MTLIIKMKTFQPSFPSNWSLIDSHQCQDFSFYLVSILDRLGDILTLGGIFRVFCHCFAQGGADHFLVELGQLPAEADAPVFPEGLRQIFQGGQQLVGSFIEDHGALFALQGFQVLPAALFGGGEEALKAEPARCLAGDAQRRDGGTGAGNGTDSDACGGALLHQILAGIGNGRTAGIGYQGAGLTGQDPFHNFITFESLVVLVVANQAFFDAQMVQQLQRNPGIFRGNEICSF